MAKSTLRRRGRNRAAAVLSLGGFVLAACSAMSDQPAPVYMVRIVSTGIPEAAASGPIMREMAGPVALAPSLTLPTAMGHPASDVIPLDNPPPQPPPAPARQAADPVAVAAIAPPPAAPAPMPTPAPVPTLAASPAIVASPPPIIVPPVPVAARAEPSAAELARVEPQPSPVRAPITAEPTAADIATPGSFVKVKDDRARYRPRYYYSP
jgi:hypothetical protein